MKSNKIYHIKLEREIVKTNYKENDFSHPSNVKYIIEGGKTDFINYHFPYYQLIISKNENQIEIHLEGVEDTSSWPTETKIPENLLENIEYSEKLMNNLSKDIINRLEIIVGKKITFDFNNSYTFGYSYHLNYVHKLK